MDDDSMGFGVWHSIRGVVLKGRGWTSGQGASCPYPEGTLGLQLSHFREGGLDLVEFYLGTLNVSIKPRRFSMCHPRFTFHNVTWHPEHRPEDFSLSPCRVIYHEQTVPGVIYYPHPETKTSYFLDDSTLEIIAKEIRSIHPGSQVELEINTNEVEIA